MPVDVQDTLDKAAPEPGLNHPTEEQAVRQAVAEVLAEENKEAIKAEVKQAEASKDDPAQAALDAAAKAEAEKQAEKEEQAKEVEQSAAKAAADAVKRRDLELAERMGKLADQERRLRAREADIKKSSIAVEEKYKAAEAERSKLQQVVDLLGTNPERAYRLAGKDFGSSMRRALEIQKNPALALQEALEDKTAALKADFEGKLAEERALREKEQKDEQERQRLAFEEQDRKGTVQAVTQAIADAKDAEGNLKFELIAAEGREQEIGLELWQHWKQTGEVVSLNEYLSHVEGELEKRLEEKILKTKKVQKKLGGAPAPKATVAAKAEDDDDGEGAPDEAIDKTIAREKRRLRRTLTNATSTRSAPPPAKAQRVSSGDPFKDARDEVLEMMEAGKL